MWEKVEYLSRDGKKHLIKTIILKKKKYIYCICTPSRKFTKYFLGVNVLDKVKN